MEKADVSLHEVRVFQLLRANPKRWFTNVEIANEAQVARRTARLHTLRFVKLGLLDLAQVFPGHRYRWAQKSSNRNAAYVLRLEKAMEAFGVL